MHLVILMMLQICVPSIATGFAEVEGGAEPIRAGMVLSRLQDEAEAEEADTVSKEAPAAPTKAAGELTDGERLFQGAWQLNEYKSDTRLGTLHIDDRDFKADSVHGRHAGYVSIRADTSPAQIDFTIEDCECKFEGMTSTGIYYEGDGTIVFAGPAPGDPRPEAFTKPNEMWRLHPLDPATAGDDDMSR
jgi:hypothetical protein